MRSCQILVMRPLLLFALVAMASNVVWARSAVLSLDFPLTGQEQAARLRSLAGTEFLRRIHPSDARVASRVRPMVYFQRNYEGQWFEGPLDDRINRRRFLSEKMGEQGRARFAAERGLTKLLGSRNKTINQGPDSVYRDPRSGRVVVLEAKGGGSPLKWSFNSRQGTNVNTVRSAKNVILRYRRSADRAMKVQMARVILAAEKGQLDTGVIRTRYVLGRPNRPGLDGLDSAQVAREARRARREIIGKYPKAGDYFREANRDHLRDWKAFRAAHRSSRLKQRATQGLRVIGFAGVLGLGWDSYQQSRAAWSMFDDPTLSGSVLPYMQTAVALGRAGQATALAGGMAGPSSILNLSAKGRAVRFAGRAFVPISFGVEGLQVVTAYHEYDLGRISQRELYQRTAGPAIFAGFTLGGAAIGSIVGFQAGGAGAIPGAMAGAKVGAVVAIPIQVAADHVVSWYYREFDEQQRQTVNLAVEAFYGLEANQEAIEY